jgi:acetyl esterase/lipase
MRTTAVLCHSALAVCVRRTFKGPRRPDWNWAVELGTEGLKAQLAAAFAIPDVTEARRYLDAVVLKSTALAEVSIAPSSTSIRGSWFVPKREGPRATMLYLHGGGYSFYSKGHASLIALITVAAQSRTFALDYRLAPESRFPAQLEDAFQAYRWLLDSGVSANDLVIAGDSAGGNLTLALLLAVRDAKLPLPALAVVLSPATDFDLGGGPMEDGTSLCDNEPWDWIDRRMLGHWADWFCSPDQRRDPLVSPIYADLRGLPPIYIQAGGAEILYDSIQAFADCARKQGANVVRETWPTMNHDFQMFGYHAPQSKEALRRIGEVVAANLRQST